MPDALAFCNVNRLLRLIYARQPPRENCGPNLAAFPENAGLKKKMPRNQTDYDPKTDRARKMRQAATQELYSYWNKLRGARLSPERAEIDPAEIRHILADTMILEVDEERQFPVRISGTRLNALFLGEQKGQALVSLFAPAERETVSAMILSVIEGARPIVAGLSAAPEGGEAATLELLLLPLRHRGKTHSRILGALTPSAIPSWLGLRQVECLKLVAMRFIDDGVPGPDVPMPHHRTPQTPAELASHNKTRRRSFFVIPGGRNS
jgi:hypothetical protein